MAKRETTIESLISHSIEVGNKLEDIFDSTQDIKVIAQANKAYANSIRAGSVCIAAKKQTGAPSEIKHIFDKVRTT